MDALVTFIGYVVILGIILVLGTSGFLFIWKWFTRFRCPKCHHSVFELRIGGPPACANCGWSTINIKKEMADWKFRHLYII